MTVSGLRRAVASPSPVVVSAVDEARAAILDVVAPPVSSRRRWSRRREEGDEVDIDRWARRESDCWDRMTRTRAPARRAVVGVNLATASRATPEDVVYRGAAAAALVDILTSRGVAVEVRALVTSTGWTSKGASALVVTVQTSDSPLDIGALSSALSDLGVVRLGFFCGGSRLLGPGLDDGLGRPCDAPEWLTADIDYMVPRKVETLQAAIDWARRVMAE
jgi:hypothetical protein